MKIIDISHVIDGSTPVFPGDFKASLAEYKSTEKDGCTTFVLKTCMHTGTHIDLPMHLTGDKKTAADYPPDKFIGKGVLLDVRGENPVIFRPEYTKAVSEGDIVLLLTGFDRYYNKNGYFTEYPAVDGGLADFFVSKKIRVLGIDTPSPDYPPYDIHKKLLSNGIFILENLTNLQALCGTDGFEVIALPLKISAEASLVRAVAVYKSL